MQPAASRLLAKCHNFTPLLYRGLMRIACQGFVTVEPKTFTFVIILHRYLSILFTLLEQSYCTELGFPHTNMPTLHVMLVNLQPQKPQLVAKWKWIRRLSF